MDDNALERFYRENLEEKLIFRFAELEGISLDSAMDIYYHSRLARLINEGVGGIQYLDYKVLAQMLADAHSGAVAPPEEA